MYVHGLVRDADGEKMSKSKGNVLDPLDLIDGIELEALVEKRTTGLMQPQMAERIAKTTGRQFPDGIPSFGADALRFTFASLATQGRDIRFDLGRIEGFRNFCNKLWNPSRCVMMITESLCGHPLRDFETGPAERWITSRLQQVAGEISKSMEAYRFDQVVQTLHAFTWDEYCSWYLEIAKIQLSDAELSDSRKDGVRQTLVNTLDNALRLTHPVMPFITEALWQQMRSRTTGEGDSIMHQPSPQRNEQLIDGSAGEDLEWVQAVVGGIRNIRGEMNICLLYTSDAADEGLGVDLCGRRII